VETVARKNKIRTGGRDKRSGRQRVRAGLRKRRPRPWYITTAAREAVGPERRSATLERVRLESVRTGQALRLEVGSVGGQELTVAVRRFGTEAERSCVGGRRTFRPENEPAGGAHRVEQSRCQWTPSGKPSAGTRSRREQRSAEAGDSVLSEFQKIHSSAMVFPESRSRTSREPAGGNVAVEPVRLTSERSAAGPIRPRQRSCRQDAAMAKHMAVATTYKVGCPTAATLS
jgi:hypothetical protein